ncbi:MAG: hypothetical protein CO013_04110 [Syntrophobacterales bacterium CG_4_8_14_3_um_filter_58_8]|nr:MAG: hypothetical protein AUK26_06940 [Syntrophaceae bacterium CG2_30_58_14]PIV02447.1 MAG: hypothetical protein COS57_12275 [Syntrophobacterales bacterium CG03_land_8_20_14_0_80_58_14]PJC74604.1 MAG: hypothetical protein CO013_04110 [Syntrophobacterales bacterium CG_4_8_14_3_um_filter_58_8]
MGIFREAKPYNGAAVKSLPETAGGSGGRRRRVDPALRKRPPLCPSRKSGNLGTDFKSVPKKGLDSCLREMTIYRVPGEIQGLHTILRSGFAGGLGSLHE